MLRNLHLTFVLCSASEGEDFAKFCGLLRIYELYDRSIFCLPNRPKFSGFFDSYLNWVSVVHALVVLCVRVNTRYEVQFSMPCFRHMACFSLTYTRKDYQLPQSIERTEKCLCMNKITTICIVWTVNDVLEDIQYIPFFVLVDVYTFYCLKRYISTKTYIFRPRCQ